MTGIFSMSWKRTLSRRKKDGAETDSLGPTEEEVKEYLAALVTELNLRLLLESGEHTPASEDRDICMAPPEKMLWVENITLTSYEEAKPVRGWRRGLKILVNVLRKRI